MPTPRSRASASNRSPRPHSAASGLPPAEAYERFLKDAEALPDAEIVTCRADVALLLHNVQLGVESIRPHEARLRKELPALKLEPLWSLPDLAAGLIYAADRVGGPASKAEVAAKLDRLRKLREPMLVIAEGLALWGLLPSERVTAIRAGKGAFDAARDGIALEALYREYAGALAHKHPFSAADFKEVADLGNHLVRAITPDGGRQRVELRSGETRTRDRFYTLLTQRHAQLRKAGFYLFGEEVDIHVPLPGARVLGSRKPIVSPSPVPEPVPAPQ